MIQALCALARKIPMHGRSFLICLACVSFSARALAEAPEERDGAALRESDVIRLAREKSPGAAVASATEKAADSHSRSRGAHPNPQLVWARESVSTGPVAVQGSEDLFGVNIPVEAVRPGAARALVKSESEWMRVEASLSRTEAVRGAVLSYYEVAIAEKRVQVLSEAVRHIEEAARVLERRQAEGAASGYERARLALESELTKSKLAQAQAVERSARTRLASALGLSDQTLRVAADLALISPSDSTALAQSQGTNCEALSHAERSRGLALRASDRASWTWLPDFEVGAGLKRASDAGSSDGLGYFVGVNVSLPVFDRGQSERAAAESQRQLAGTRAAFLSRAIAADIQVALSEFESARLELERFDKGTAGHVEQMVRAAQRGYGEGERTVTELVDAQRAQTEVALRRLELIALAKRAEVDLRSATGELK